MDIIITGCGKVGLTLAKKLDEEGHNVTVIDTDSKRLSQLPESNIYMITGNGAAHSSLDEANVKTADLLIAVTNSDELNILCCLIAKKLAPNLRTIARVRNPDYSFDEDFLKNNLGLAMTINPESYAADEIARILMFPAADKIDTFAGGKVEMIKFRIPAGSMLEGMRVWDVPNINDNVLVCIIERGDEAYVPHGEFVIEPNDIVSFVATHNDAKDFFKKIGFPNESVKNVMIAGCGEIGYNLIKILQREDSGRKMQPLKMRSKVNITVIEKDPARVTYLAENFPSADITIIEDDATASKESLEQYNISAMGGIVALTNMDEENILFSLFAIDATKGKAKVITKINRLDFDEVINNLPLDITVYPKNLTTDMIVRYVRGMKNTLGSNVETLYTLVKGEHKRIEAAEFIVKEGSPVIGIPLKDLNVNKDALVAAIISKGVVTFPKGDSMIRPGDSVVVVMSGMKALNDIKDIIM